MLYQILSFLLNTAIGIAIAACLLRVYMQGMRMGFSNPLGRVVLTLSDPMVLPLRRLHASLRSKGRWDWLPLLIAFALAVIKNTLLLGVQGLWLPTVALMLGLFDVLSHAVGLAMAAVLGCAVLSWLVPQHWLYSFLDRLCAPLLHPLRRALPTPGGIDFSPLLATAGLYIVLIVLEHSQRQILVQYLHLPLPL